MEDENDLMHEYFAGTDKEFVQGGSSLLNKSKYHSIAAIAWNVTVSKGTKWVDGSLSISDCNRAVYLDTSFGIKEEDFENSIFKIETLIAVLEGVKRGLKEARKVQLAIQEQKENEEKTE